MKTTITRFHRKYPWIVVDGTQKHVVGYNYDHPFTRVVVLKCEICQTSKVVDYADRKGKLLCPSCQAQIDDAKNAIR